MTDDLLAQWSRWQHAQGHSNATIGARTARVRAIALTAGVAPEDMDQDHIVNYLAGLHTRSTRSTYFSHLRAWFRWLALMDYRADDPTLKIPAPRAPRRAPRPVTDVHFVALLNSRMHRRTRMMILLAAFQGLRVHEIAKIRGEDVDLIGQQLRVVGKGDVDVTLPLHPDVAAFAATFPRKGYWFPAGAGSTKPGAVHVTSRSVSDIVGDAMHRVGIDGGAHRLRHWYGTTLAQSGVNLRVVQTLLRHASLQTTQIYTEVNVGQMKAAIDGLSVTPAESVA